GAGEHEIADVTLRIRVEHVNARGRVVGDRAERIEADCSICVVSSPFDYLNRAVEKRTDALSLSDVVFFAGRQNGPGRASPDSVDEGKRSDSLTLSRDECGGVRRALSGSGESGSQDYDQNQARLVVKSDSVFYL